MPSEKSTFQRLNELTILAALQGHSILEMAQSEDVGAHLREWRTAKGLSLRSAASQLGIAYSILQKMETGGRARTPDLDFLQRVALVYSVPTAEVLQAAGYSLRHVEDVRDAIDHAFRQLVMNPDLRPSGMDAAWLDSFSTKQKRQWLEFAWRLQSYIDSEDHRQLPVSRDVVNLFGNTGEEEGR